MGKFICFLVLFCVLVMGEDVKSAKRKFGKLYQKKHSEKERLEAVSTLTTYDDPGVVKILVKVMDIDSSARVYKKIIRFLSRTQNPKSHQQIHRLAKKRYKIHTQTALLKVCGKLGGKISLKILTRACKNRTWEVRCAAIGALADIKDKKIISLLIERLKKEKGRIQDEAYKALSKATGMNLPMSHTAWESWWLNTESSFSFENVQRKSKRQKNRKGSHVQYYKFRLVSKNIIFILDNSHSMKKRAGKSKYKGAQGKTRLEQAKAELVKTIDKLPKDVFFNVFEYNGDVITWQKKLVKATKKNKQKAIKFVKHLSTQYATATYDALEKALNMRQADTIFLLTDGMPVKGKISKPTKIIKAIVDLNKGRNVVINTIGVALGKRGARFLRRLAKQNKGEYVKID